MDMDDRRLRRVRNKSWRRMRRHERRDAIVFALIAAGVLAGLWMANG
jgi:hypothetical protein